MKTKRRTYADKEREMILTCLHNCPESFGTWVQKYDSNTHLYSVADNLPNAKCEFLVDNQETDNGEPTTEVLTYEKCRKGLELMSEYSFETYEDLYWERDDANTHDVLLQYALFGKIVFC